MTERTDDKDVTPHPISFYAKQIRSSLPADIFAPVRNRLLWLAFHVAVAGFGIYAVARGWGGWGLAPVWSLLIGHAFAGFAFVGHETLHGAVVRNRVLRHLIGWLCFMPIALSPRLWVVWHNKVHHGHTMDEKIDPDAFPTLAAWKASPALRAVDQLSVGSGRLAGIFMLLFGFSGQSGQMLLSWGRKEGRASGAMSQRNWRLALLESLLAVAIWTALAVAVGPLKFIFAYLIPLGVVNMIVISYILTNHSLSPLGEVNDPLLNSLSVTAPGPFNWLHLHFGLHVEHHLFPSMSSANAHLVRDQLKARWPERYQIMPLFRALALLWKTPRVYASPTVLIDPNTGKQVPTLHAGLVDRVEDAPPPSLPLVAAST